MKQSESKSLRKWMEEKQNSIGKAEGFIEDAIAVLEWYIDKLQRTEPYATNSHYVLRTAKVELEDCRDDSD